MFVPDGFTNLSITVFDEDAIGEDERIGKITFKCEVLAHCPRGVEKWFPLSPVYNDDDIQGELRIETTVVEKANKSTSFPQKYHVFEFESMAHMNDLKVVATVLDRMDAHHSLGEAIVFLSKHTIGHTQDVWYKLLPLPHKRQQKPGNLGSIRLKVSLMEEYVLPSLSYTPLLDLIMQPAGIQSNSVDALSIIGDMTTIDHACVARNLVKIFLGQNCLITLLDWMTNKEMQRTTSWTTLFRGNSLTTKAVDQFMKAKSRFNTSFKIDLFTDTIVGMPYLISVLKPTIDKIFDEHKNCELDVNMLEKPKTSGIRRLSLRPQEEDVISRSATALCGYVDSIMTAILTSMLSCPVLMRLFFRNLTKRAYQHFGEDNDDLKYQTISGFLFLRFFAPAILGPKLFSLRDHHADKTTARTLTLLAKIVQKISNMKSQDNARNDDWMAPLSSRIEMYSDHLKDFFDKIMDVDDSEAPSFGRRRSVFDQSVVIKEGYLKKCRFNIVKLPKSFVFKKRYCWLSAESFLYSHSPDAETRQFLPSNKIVAVEKVDDSAFQKSNVFQVISEEYEGAIQTLYLSCHNVNEMNQWMSAIRKTMVNNHRKLTLFHSGVYQHKWKCCGRVNRTCAGCSRSNSQVILSDWRDPLDPDAEIQMIYTQLFLSRDELKQKFLEGSTRESEDEEGGCRPRDEVRVIVANLLEVIDKLHESHRGFDRKEAKKRC
ncbi:hypothetical protein QZH41_010566 [Actinostola sp. cb2023]|nr:hypothetical protein QZH41_010566 [Actinostola sp. cb2023]